MMWYTINAMGVHWWALDCSIFVCRNCWGHFSLLFKVPVDHCCIEMLAKKKTQKKKTCVFVVVLTGGNRPLDVIHSVV